MRARRVIVAGALIAASFATACQLLLDDNTLSVPAAGADATTVDASDGGVDATVACVSIQPPSGASSDDGGTSGAGTIYLLAVRTLEVGNAPGFDLDHTCTCCACDPASERDGGNNSCVLPQGASSDACDGDGGIDDEFSVLRSFAPGAFLTHIVGEADRIAGCGERTLLFGLFDYNGMANDPEVELTSTTGFGIRDPHDGGELPDAGIAYCGSNAGTPYYRPKWDGTDLWSVAPNTTTTNGVPLSQPIKAHVSNYQFILDSREPDQAADLVLSFYLFGTTPVRFGSPVLVATIVPLYADGGAIPMDGGVPIDTPALFAMTQGQVAGRADRNDVLMAAALAPTDAIGTPVCASALFIAGEATLCGYADIALDSQDDSMGKPCNAFSTSLSFTAYPAAVGQVYDGGDVTDASCDASQLTCDTD